ncbi:iron complex transport system substrate-binding protein [Geothermobacter ehrlichii]|uniref:Iron complex transport system substrate-binding protein n=1 Tax=Geothermobacter ehrlichii TaxID=213224 RepID=A0A5D3WGV5_9BACT|nr:cobalamin-binding protein [Geothermobacter ehrlichii]TYO97701.1 iron complex transport system substrate-binding protein [Geothermobacter ehrlichii]
MKRIVLVSLLICCLLSPVAARAAVWTDAVGRRVELPDQPRRIVSLVPAVTEILFALGLDERIAGVTRFCDWPEAARSKPKVGGYANPSLEAVLQRQPDLVFVSADVAGPNLLARMERLGLKVYVVYPRGLDETLAMIRAVGRVTGRAAAGEELAGELAATVARVRNAVAGKSRPRVLFCVMMQPLTVAGPETLVGDLIEAAGGVNVVSAGVSRYPTWGSEALLLADPDVIVVSPHPGTPDPAGLFSAWPELTAVKTGRIVSINPDWVHRPGPRLGRGLVALAAAFHGIDPVSLQAEVQP